MNFEQFDLSPELIREFRDLESILKGNTSFVDRYSPDFKYLSNYDFYAVKFLERAQDIFAKTKNNAPTYRKVFQVLVQISGENGYPYMGEEIRTMADNVWRTTTQTRQDKLVQNVRDSLFRVAQTTLPTNNPTTEQTKPKEMKSPILKVWDRIFGKDIRTGVKSNFWFFILFTLLSSATIWTLFKVATIKLLVNIINILVG